MKKLALTLLNTANQRTFLVQYNGVDSQGNEAIIVDFIGSYNQGTADQEVIGFQTLQSWAGQATASEIASKALGISRFGDWSSLDLSTEPARGIISYGTYGSGCCTTLCPAPTLISIDNTLCLPTVTLPTYVHVRAYTVQVQCKETRQPIRKLVTVTANRAGKLTQRSRARLQQARANLGCKARNVFSRLRIRR